MASSIRAKAISMITAKHMHVCYSSNAPFCSFSTASNYIVIMEYICSYSLVKLLNALPKERRILLPHEGWVSPLSFFLTLTLTDPGTMIFPQR